MELVSLVGMAALALTAAGPDGLSPDEVARRPRPEPISTRQTLFSIPFQVDRPERPEQEPVEVRLYVSADRGATWHLYSKVEPKRGYFLFRAAGDGVFWFLIRTLDRAGQLRPPRTDGPGLIVVVDTTPPSLELKAQRGAAGQVTAEWQVDEPNFDSRSLRIRYRTAPHSAWQFVAVDHDQVTREQSVHRGEVTWWVPSDVARVEIRAEASDTAGNPTVTHAQLTAESAPVSDPAATYDSAIQQRQQALLERTGQGSAVSGWQPSVDPPARRAYTFPPSNRADQPSPYAAGYGDAPRTGEGSPAVQVHPPVRNQYAPPAAAPAASDTSVVPPGEPLRWVRSSIFELDYDVESVGSSGIDRVELWGTGDGGRTWSSFGIDDDNKSPLLVTVREEGIYGFRVAVRNGAGLGGTKPRAGDKPHVWIGVDQTRPSARILSTEQSGTGEAGQLLVKWKADDPMLADRPISLFFSDAPGGPWTPIATGLDNSGEHLWRRDCRDSERIYLRLEVRDRAGNVGVDETNTAIAGRQLQPVVRIRDVHPLDHSARTLAKRYFLR